MALYLLPEPIFSSAPQQLGQRKDEPVCPPSNLLPGNIPGSANSTPGPPWLPGFFSPLISSRSPNLKLKGKEKQLMHFPAHLPTLLHRFSSHPLHHKWAFQGLSTSWILHTEEMPKDQDHKSPINSGMDGFVVWRRHVASFNWRNENHKDWMQSAEALKSPRWLHNSSRIMWER